MLRVCVCVCVCKRLSAMAAWPLVHAY